jgi:hypothetical protein
MTFDRVDTKIRKGIVAEWGGSRVNNCANNCGTQRGQRVARTTDRRGTGGVNTRSKEEIAIERGC